jgi:hypothetical protein
MNTNQERASMVAVRDRLQENFENEQRERLARIAWINALTKAWEATGTKYKYLGEFMGSTEGKEFERNYSTSTGDEQ